MRSSKRLLRISVIGILFLMLFSSIAFAARTLPGAGHGTVDVGVQEEESVEEPREIPLVRGNSISRDLIREAIQDSELLSMRMNALPQVTRSNSEIKIRGSSSTDAKCYSGRTEYVLGQSYDCSEGLKEGKQTSFYTAPKKEYGYVETSFGLDEKPKSVRVVYSVDSILAHQYDMSIFYRESREDSWKLICYGLEASSSPKEYSCDVPSELEDSNVEIRAEVYAREGHATVNLESVSISGSTENNLDVDGAILNGGNLIPPFIPPVPPGDDPIIIDFDPVVDGLETSRGVHLDDGILVNPNEDDDPLTPGDIPLVDDTIPFLLSIGHPLATSPPTSTPSVGNANVETVGEAEQQTPVATETGEGVNAEENSEPLPLTGAAIFADFVGRNKAGLGLLLLGLVIVGYVTFQSKNTKRRRVRR
jgi:hypothetical protein